MKKIYLTPEMECIFGVTDKVFCLSNTSDISDLTEDDSLSTIFI